MKSDILQRLIQEYLNTNSPDGLAKHVADLISQDRELRITYRQLINEEADEKNRHKEQMNVIDVKIRKLRLQCPHYDFTYHGDPSGNNDSFYACSLCGHEW